MGKFKSLWVCFGRRKLETVHGRWNRAGQGGKEMWLPIGIWEPLLRFIGVGILRTWGIIHGKASLSGSVYKMRQGWQRWRPSTTGPSCLNMGLSHLTYPWHQLQPFTIPLKNTQTDKVSYNTKRNCQFLSHVLSVVSNWKVWPYRYMHIFQSPNANKMYDFSLRGCHIKPSAFFFFFAPLRTS